MNLEKSKTLQSLINAFAGESMARNRYTIFAKIAQKEGYEQIGAIFLETAENEREHAKLFYKYIPIDEHARVDAEYPFYMGNTLENLLYSVNGEREEWENIYREASNIAKEEGFSEISLLFYNISEIEKRHSHRFQVLAELLKKDEIYKKKENVQWICRKCGHTHISKNAPVVCPVCGHPESFFQIYNEIF